MVQGPFFDIDIPSRGDLADRALDALRIDDPRVRGALKGAYTGRGLVPNTRVRTTHALSIHARVNGSRRIVGAVHGWTVRQGRQIDEEWEIDVNATGSPAELIPQALTTRTISIARYDLFSEVFEQAFGRGFTNDEIVELTAQFKPMTLREVWITPQGFIIPGRRAYEYGGCYFQEIGRTLRADDSRIVNVEATALFRTRRRII